MNYLTWKQGDATVTIQNEGPAIWTWCVRRPNDLPVWHSSASFEKAEAAAKALLEEVK